MRTGAALETNLRQKICDCIFKLEWLLFLRIGHLVVEEKNRGGRERKGRGERRCIPLLTDTETTCTAVTTVPRDSEPLKSTAAEQTGISISVLERKERRASCYKKHRLLRCVREELRDMALFTFVEAWTGKQ